MYTNTIERQTHKHKSPESEQLARQWLEANTDSTAPAHHNTFFDFDHHYDDYHDKIMTLWWDYDYYDDSDDDYVENTKMVKAFFIWGWGQNSMQLG